jgi:hypothetical protein
MEPTFGGIAETTLTANVQGRLEDVGSKRRSCRYEMRGERALIAADEKTDRHRGDSAGSVDDVRPGYPRFGMRSSFSSLSTRSSASSYQRLRTEGNGHIHP